MQSTNRRSLAKTLLGKAPTYADNHWDLLRAIEIDGALEIDNGDVERILRGPAMGRGNLLFAGSDEDSERTAIMLTVLKTTARQGVDLRAYQHDILVYISGGIKLERLDELLPENWAKSRSGA
ncbi:MAG: transposase [Myxococcales bacterium]|nr:transposase [Myxococcales bacterium]